MATVGKSKRFEVRCNHPRWETFAYVGQGEAKHRCPYCWVYFEDALAIARGPLIQLGGV